MQARICLCISVLALLGSAAGMNVNRMEIEEEKGEKRDENVLFFEPSETKIRAGNGTACKKYFCSGNRTCCERGNGTAPNCCPYPQGVCCLDGIHCCPKQSFCDMAHRRCFRTSNAFVEEMHSMVLASRKDLFPNVDEKMKAGNGTSCKNPEYFCSGGRTCCERGNSTAPNCCPYPQVDFSKQARAFLRPEVPVESVTCTDGSKCPDGNTCCKDAQGEPACCPLPEAVCCEDHVHCCPKDYTCDVPEGKCNQGNSSVPAAVKTHVVPMAVKGPASVSQGSIPCPSGDVSCPTGNTCCLTVTGEYGCCPFPKAICCSDHIHCCPSGYTCDVSSGTCNKAVEPSTPEVSSCPDDSCLHGETCCRDQQGMVSCCPLSQGVCCADNTHCCPKGYTCDTNGKACRRGNDMTWLTKVARKPAPPLPRDTVCPDQSRCPDGETCCEDTEGTYGCCPFPSAICCSDKLHCCPEGYTCDVSAGTCNRGTDLLPWFTKKPPKGAASVQVVTCPDKSTCPDQNTCCQVEHNKYACCPLPKAVCCSDQRHCCPHGFTCDSSAESCKNGDTLLPWLTKRPASPSSIKGASAENDVICSQEFRCPDEDTCCEDQEGGYGCCPLPNAVCCSDKLHCCPEGYTCDVSSGQCSKGNNVLSWLTKLSSKPALKDVVCPDQSVCPSGNTCCESQSGGYGCCPVPNAVCCSDKLHCCPEGYTCDVSSGQCSRGNNMLSWLTKLSSKPAPALKDVVCPDQSVCPSGNTCCESQSGGYGCCPIPNAVCCSDKLHCCPEGYTCDVSSGQCSKGNNMLSWLTKLSSKPAVKDVVCPDQSVCPSGNTCCESQSGGYGCCPVPNAVCCSDKLHCCPEGYTCDVSSGQCSKGNNVLSWLIKLSSKPAPALKDVVCPDQSVCPSGNTCCESQSGAYGCCPVPNAVCCSDKLHCCPEGYTCDVSSGQCSRGNNMLSWLTKLSSKPAPALKDVVCPDQSVCPSGNTCCESQSGGYGCCPIPNAVCCSDKLHCCPEGYTCDVSSGQCSKGNNMLSWLTKLSSKPAVKDVVCPDQSVCPSGNTCCESQSGGYGCCPVPNAVCCSDKLHCCPEGYTCDVSSGQCSKGNNVLSWLTKLSSKPALKDVVCPDQSVCPSGNTCCESQSGAYGCCPVPNAVCCSDKLHCCPEGYTCDVSSGQCSKGNNMLSWLTKVSSKPAPALKDVVCPDQSVCPSGNTCCESQSGGYGCCPIPNAVCCSDKLHCCPEGYTCDVSSGQCSKGNNMLSWLTKLSSKPAVKDVVCPDQSVCPSGNTCCESQSGAYGCCPVPNAVCCSDKLHCCPEGYTCDVSSGQCSKGNNMLSWLTKLSSKSAPALKDVVCPDQSVCPSGNTCCESQSGAYGCCPVPNAVCCSDKLHCCPEGYTCDVSSGQCSKGNNMLSWLTKLSSKPAPALKDVVCPDQSVCPGGNTCCESQSGGYGCCPVPNAVCCSDKLHCCPEGYTCDVSSGQCSKGNNMLSWLTKLSSKPAPVLNDVVCPDQQSSCPSGNTCCETSEGGYGCCPLPDAVCCSDKLHCCPEGYTCDVSSGQCSKGNNIQSWLTKLSSKPASALKDVVCPDQSVCPSGNTCCESQSGGYGCCPVPNAVCCSDKLHCCPEGYTCDVSSGQCSKGNNMLSWLTKLPSKPASALKDVVCPDQSVCPSGNTCCESQSGAYGCCPVPNAVCCSDKLHCCPEGYTCDVSSGQCSKGNNMLSWLTKLSSKPALKDVVCPDQSVCPSGNTCCESQSGAYGCCPVPNAVCCSDKLHCCPEGYTCDVSSGQCSKGNNMLSWLTKLSSKTAPALKDVVCPDQSVCPSGNTCCESQSGTYGCCPIPNAVCCSDKLHCCPEGYTCDVSSGQCSKGNNMLSWLTKLSSKPAPALKDVVCPDQSVCPSGNTCCESQSGAYGCCPVPNAVCCSDKLHCCPEGYTCDVSSGQCSKGNNMLSWLTKLSSKAAPALKDVVCPDQSVCPSGNTCCESQSGGYGCCPIPNAVCCSDKLHCCPEGYTCDVSSGQCSKGNNMLSWLTKLSSKPAPALKDVVCPDQSVCPSGNTCCETNEGVYGCCPLPNAVCCSDNIHCCPEGYTCDVSAGSCSQGVDHLTWFTKLSTKNEALVDEVTCPDESKCPNGQTCCEDQEGGYACCPLPSAVCCSDKVHCCPEGYTCDISAGKCSKGNDMLSWLTKLSSKPAPALKDVVCPDQSVCPSGNTCCESQSGGYGCCPIPNAVCCSDKLHCCPEGYTCDVSSGQCSKGNDILNWLTKQLSKPSLKEVICPDKSMCPSGNTCCMIKGGGYGCCPFPNAICCSDDIHCCPSGYTCDVSAGRCAKGSDSLTWFTKQSARTKPLVDDVTCPDQSRCPDGQTCCENQAGGYGCCPLPSAVCCSDKLHCCPEEYTCDTAASRCFKGTDIVAWSTKVAAKSPSVVKDIPCPDGSKCPGGSTCCATGGGRYGCCPQPDATCCDDDIHCCPSGYRCNTAGGSCVKGTSAIPWLTKHAAKPASLDTECIVPNAICCADNIHYCPKNTVCDLSTQECRGEGFVTSLGVIVSYHVVQP